MGEGGGDAGGLDIAWVSGQVWSLMLLDGGGASAEVPGAGAMRTPQRGNEFIFGKHKVEWQPFLLR